MPLYRKDPKGGVYKLFVENKFRDDQGVRDLCRYFDEAGREGVADLQQCLMRTTEATEEEYLRLHSQRFV